jgi:hypothetical protein
MNLLYTLTTGAIITYGLILSGQHLVLQRQASYARAFITAWIVS